MSEFSFVWVSPYDPGDARGGWKSMQHYLLRALDRSWGKSFRIAPVTVAEEAGEKWFSRFQKQLGIPRRYAYYSEARLDSHAQSVAARMPVANRKPIVFFGALPFVKCRPAAPYYIYTDSAFFIHYWEYNRDHTHARSEIDRICAAEADFMRRAAGIWCSSQWVAGRIASEYSIPEERIHFVGTGPGDVPVPENPPRYENFLVMIAADFERKRGRLAVDSVRHARRQIADLSIKFIGAKPPSDITALPFVEWCGWLDLSRSQDRSRFCEVMSRAGAQILLSRADLTPLAIPEAALYAKATLATAVGGIPEMIQDGENGWLVPKDSTPDQISTVITEMFRHSQNLPTAGAAAQRAQQEHWNWNAVAEAASSATLDLSPAGK